MAVPAHKARKSFSDKAPKVSKKVAWIRFRRAVRKPPVVRKGVGRMIKSLVIILLLIFPMAVAAQDPGEPVATFNPAEDFQYAVKLFPTEVVAEEDWVTFTPSYTEEITEGIPTEHLWVHFIRRSPVMYFVATFEDSVVESPRALLWSVDTSIGGILLDVRQQFFYMRWRNRYYPEYPEYETVGDWSDPSNYVRVLKIFGAGRALGIKSRG